MPLRDPPATERNRTFKLVDALDPQSGKLTYTASVTNDRMLNHVARSGQAAVIVARELMPEVLAAPSAVFEGIRWDDDQSPNDDGWRCYAGVPSRDFRPDDNTPDATVRQVSWREGFVFVVFLTREGIAYAWRREQSDPNNPRLPIQHHERFRKQIFP